MMKTIKYLSMAALLVVGAIIMSCSTSDDMPGEDQPKSQTVTVTTTISLDNGATRALDASGHKTFEAGDKIAQLVLAPVTFADPYEVQELSETDRGTGGFGSTGR